VEQGHQEVDLGLWPLPVFDAEAVQRELAEAEAAAFLDGAANALDAAAVPSMRGKPRCWAHRPLPSMMTATCRGTAISPIWPVRSASFLVIRINLTP